MRITVVNASNMVVKRAVLRLHLASYPVYRGDSIIFTNLQIGKSFDIRYNLEHTDVFGDYSRRLEVTFDNPENTYIQRELGTVTFRRSYQEFTATIKSDTIIRP
jgi:hypothetical protein